jgi:hypothetical protein
LTSPSNGDPRDPASLHHIGQNPNEYSTAIQAVGEIIQDYDSDKQFPCYGFGAKIPPKGSLSHNFHLSLAPSNPNIRGIEHVLSAYQRTSRVVELYGPTNFSPVIGEVSQIARKCSWPSNYFVLLIITDGLITDMTETQQAIIAASSLPLSIIIVGVGNADFSAMSHLDGDSDSSLLERDIVQFVEMRRYLAGPGQWNRQGLLNDVLAEVPRQMQMFMASKGLKPMQRNNGPITGSLASAPPVEISETDFHYQGEMFSSPNMEMNQNYNPQASTNPMSNNHSPSSVPYPLSSQYTNPYPPNMQPGHQYPPLGQQYPPLGNQYPALQHQYPPSGNQYPAIPHQYPPSENQYPLPGLLYPATHQQYPPANDQTRL